MLTTTVYDEVTGEYYTRKATEFDCVGDPGEKKHMYVNDIIQELFQARSEFDAAEDKLFYRLQKFYPEEIFDEAWAKVCEEIDEIWFQYGAYSEDDFSNALILIEDRLQVLPIQPKP